MKSNQMMEVRINEDLSFQIGHKTRMGKVDNILAYGNLLREQRGLDTIEMKEILRRKDFWEYIISVNTLHIKSKEGNSHFEFFSDFTKLDEYKDSKGRIQYSNLIKEFPNLIKSQKGGKVENRGYWMDLHILLKVAAILDSDLEAQIYDIFINGHILELRDKGGNQFLKLNKAIDTLPDRTPELKPNGNKGCYIQVAKLIRDKLNILSTHGYNEREHNIKVQELRAKIEDFSVKMIEMKMVNSYDELKTFIINFPID